MANQNKIQEVVVVHKGPRKNSKIILEVFEMHNASALFF